MHVFRFLLMVAALFVLMFSAGCGGPSKVKISGKLTKKGQPFTTGEKTLVTLVFSAEAEGTKQTYPANVKRDEGTFQLEVPPGKYRANLIIVDYEKNAPPLIPQSVKQTIYDLSEGKEIEIDVGK